MESKRRNRLWVVSELYFPEMTSTGYYLTKISEGLADDFDVKVICGQPNYSARGETAPKREILKGVEVFRVFGTRLDKNVIPFRILNMFTLGLSVFFRSILSFRKGDKVIVVTTPPLMPFLTAVSCWIRRSKHILLVHDCYPEILYAAGKLERTSKSAAVLEFLSRTLLKHAERLIVVGRDMREMIEGKIGGNVKIDVIPNWAELETVKPSPRNENKLLQDLNLESKFVFLYAGNMGYPNDIESFVEAAKAIEDVNEGIHFVFLGAGVKKSLLSEAIQKLALNNITLLDSRPRSEQQVFLNACDVGIVSLVGMMKGVSMPSRTYNILAAGKPILALCNPFSEIAFVVEEENVGWTVQPGDVAKLVEVVLEISESAELLKEYGQNAREAALAKYSLENAVNRYRQVVSG